MRPAPGASDRQRVEGFLRRGCRQNLYSANKPSITQLIQEADDNLFDKIKYNPSHPSTTSYQRKLIIVTVFALDHIILILRTLMIIGILLIACSFTHITFPKLVFCVISVVIIH